MSIASPQTRDEFKQYIKHKLGYPVLEINVSDEQIDIAINDALQFFHERHHFNGTERGYLVFNIDDDFKDAFEGFEPVEELDGKEYKKQQNYIQLPDDVIGVVQILHTQHTSFGQGIIPGGMIFPILLGSLTGDSCGNVNSTLTSYYAIQEYLALINWMFFPPKAFNFNQRTHRMVIDGSLNRLRGGLLVMEVMIKPNPDIYPDIYDDMWLKEYATALVKAQWGRNLTKYNQVQLPGGIVINGQQILQDAQTEIQNIKDRFAMDWAEPPLDFVG
jgi:hypothetical protein